MLIAHVADTHLTARTGETGMTLEEQVELLRWIGQDAYEHGAELLVHAGDLFDALSTPAERLAAISVVRGWSARMPVVIIRGNHDRALDLGYLREIRSQCPVRVLEAPDVLTVNGAVVACLPWPRKAELVQALGTTDALEVQSVAGDAMRAVLRGLQVGLTLLGELQEDRLDGKGSHRARILLAHAELGTALMDNGQPIAGRCDIELGEADLLGVGADYVALGHIHRHQVIQGRLCYAGSPRPTVFPADTGTPPAHGYCMVEVRRGEDPVIEHRRAPYRELLTIEAVWDLTRDALLTEGGGAPVDEPPIVGASMRLKYSVSDAHRKAASEAADEARRHWLACGAHAVKIDARITPTYRVRSTAIAAARTTADRLHAWWQERGRPADERRILAKLASLEAACPSNDDESCPV